MTDEERRLLQDPAFIKRVCENFNLYADIGRMAETDDSPYNHYFASYIARLIRAHAKAEAGK